MNLHQLHAIATLIEAVTALIREASIAASLLLQPAPPIEPPVNPPAPPDSWSWTTYGNSADGSRYVLPRQQTRHLA
jgi:hypothetical protein